MRTTTGWVNWDNLGKTGEDLTDFVNHMTALPPALRPASLPALARWTAAPDGSYGVLWLVPAAEEMEEEDWTSDGRFLAYVLGALMEQGQPPILLVLNPAPE